MASRRFRGTFDHKVDAKGRVSVPAAFRKTILAGDPDADGGKATVVLIWGRAEYMGWKCIEGYTVDGAEELYDDLEQGERFDADSEFLTELVLSRSAEVEVDDNGRMGLRADLRDMIGLDVTATEDKAREIRFVGLGEKFQIWMPAEYEADFARRAAKIEGDPFKGVGRRRRARDDA